MTSRDALAAALYEARRYVAAEWVEEGVSRPDYATTGEMADAILSALAAEGWGLDKAPSGAPHEKEPQP